MGAKCSWKRGNPESMRGQKRLTRYELCLDVLDVDPLPVSVPVSLASPSASAPPTSERS